MNKNQKQHKNEKKIRKQFTDLILALLITIKKPYNELKLITSKFSIFQIIIVAFIFLSPIIIAIFTFFIPDWFENIIGFNYKFYLIFSILTYFYLFFCLFLFRDTILRYKNKKYNNERWSLIKTISKLLKNRVEKSEILSNFSTLIISFYVFIFSYFWIIHNNFPSLFSFVIYLLFLILFSTNVVWFIRLIAGLQDNDRIYWYLFSIFISFFWMIIIIIPGVLEQIGFNFENLFPTNEISNELIATLLIPIFVAMIVKYLTKIWQRKKNIFSKEENIDKKYWNKVFTTRNGIVAFSALMFIFITTYFIPINIFLFQELESNSSVYNIFIYVLFSFIFLIFLRFFVYIPAATREIVDTLNAWKNFFITYDGNVQNQSESIIMNKLVKISGNCIAISFKEDFREILHNDFYQQFIMNRDNTDNANNTNNTIQVVSFKEKIPFKNSADFIREGDKLVAIGEFRNFYSDWNTLNQKEIFIAYHIFKNNNS